MQSGIHPSRMGNLEQGSRDIRRDREREDRFAGEAYPEVGKVFKCTVASVRDYGAFLSIPGLKRQGLCHVSEISKYRVEKVADVLEQGGQCYAKVVSVDEDAGKIALSMKHVSQRDGEDEDPNDVLRSRGGRGRGEFTQRAAKTALEQDAILNTVCGKCGVSGHLTRECFAGATGGKKFELISVSNAEKRREQEMDELRQALLEAKARKAERKQERADKRRRKEAKKKKKKRKKRKKGD